MPEGTCRQIDQCIGKPMNNHHKPLLTNSHSTLAAVLARVPGTPPTWDHCVTRYFQQWAGPHNPADRTDKALRTDLRSPAPHVQRDALRRASAQYRVVRGLAKRHDEGINLPRLEPLRQAMEECTPLATETFDPVVLVEALTDAIARRYDRRLPSLASKIAWLRFGSPVVIYDSYARKALGLRAGIGYADYLAEWRALYDSEHAVIAASTARATFTGPDAEVCRTSHWFQERVLDILLWEVGSAMHRTA